MWQMYDVCVLDGRERVIHKVHARSALMARTMANIMWPGCPIISVVPEYDV